MSEENEFENLFDEFDSSVEEGAPPEVPESLAYTRTRGVGVLDRLSRWLVQGPGLLLAFFLLFLVPVVKEPEAGLNLPGVLLTLWLISPLLGKRPLAHHFRMAALLIPSTFLLLTSGVLVRCAIESVETHKTPIRHFTKNLLDLGEKATEPKAVVWNLVVAVALFLLARQIVRRTPWVDPSPQFSRWRRVTSFLFLGLCAGSLGALPIAYQFAWSQPWLATPWHESVDHKDWPGSEPGDLGHRHLEFIQSPPDLTTYDRKRLDSLLEDVNQRLGSEARLTQGDLRVVAPLLRFARDTKLRSQSLSELGWFAFSRSARGELHPDFVGGAFLHHTLPQVAVAPDTRVWHERLAGLAPEQPIRLEQLDAIMAHQIRQVQNRQSSFRPVRLFGQDLPIDYIHLLNRVDLTVDILVYQNLRKKLVGDKFLRPFNTKPAWPLRYSVGEVRRWLLDGLEALPGPNNYLHFEDRQLLFVILALKDTKARSGSYPSQPTEELPPGVSYSSHGATASLKVGSLTLELP